MTDRAFEPPRAYSERAFDSAGFLRWRVEEYDNWTSNKSVSIGIEPLRADAGVLIRDM
jgi:hypothetical protein